MPMLLQDLKVGDKAVVRSGSFNAYYSEVVVTKVTAKMITTEREAAAGFPTRWNIHTGSKVGEKYNHSYLCTTDSLGYIEWKGAKERKALLDSVTEGCKKASTDQLKEIAKILAAN